MKASNTTILHAIMRGRWMIEPQTAASYWPRVQRFMSGDAPSSFFYDDDEKKPKEHIVARFLENGQWKEVVVTELKNVYADVPEGSIAIVPIQGALMKADFCGEMGTSTMCDLLKQAESSDKVSGILLHQDSPGGHVDGTETLANTIKNCEKPVVGFIDGMSASASYWASSQTNYIMMSGETAEVGSIGTMWGITDMRGVYEKQGAKFHDVVSDLSPDKNKDFYQMLDGNYGPIKAELLDPLTEVFHASVKSGRPGLDQSALTGKMYLAKKAISLGLADGIGTLEDALNKVIELANADSDTTQSSNQLNNHKMFDSKLDKAVNSLAAKIKKGGLSSLDKDDFKPVNQALADAGLPGFVVASLKGLEELDGKLTKAETERDQFKAQVDKLNKGAGAEHTAPGADADTDGGDADLEVVTESEEFSAYDHNLAALKDIENL